MMNKKKGGTMNYKIKNKFTKNIIFSFETSSLKLAVIEAVKSRANLFRANLSKADLYKTILDPQNQPNQRWQEFKEIDTDWITGYRTRTTSAAGKILVNGRIYGCEIFSTCENTECHPGWYLWPTLEKAQKFSRYNVEFIKVKTRKIDIHKAKNKYRTRMIWIIGDAK